MSDLFETLAARATGAAPADVGVARARPVTRFEPALTDEQADPIEIDAEVSAFPPPIRPRAAAVEPVVTAARADSPSPSHPIDTRQTDPSPPVRPMYTRPTGRRAATETVRTERPGAVAAAVPLDDKGKAPVTGSLPLPAPLPVQVAVPVVAADRAEVDAPTAEAAIPAPPVADPGGVASAAAMVDGSAQALGDPATTPATIPDAPPVPVPVPDRIEREVSVSIGRVIVEWIDPPVTEPPAIAARLAPARTRGFTGIAAARRGVLR